MSYDNTRILIKKPARQNYNDITSNDGLADN